jgi:hypothetical protein
MKSFGYGSTAKRAASMVRHFAIWSPVACDSDARHRAAIEVLRTRRRLVASESHGPSNFDSMRGSSSKALALLGGVATIALGTSFVLRLSPAKPRLQQVPCAPRLLELERAVCEPTAAPSAKGSLH